jgi:multidrug efflux pump subunit AcrB
MKITLKPFGGISLAVIVACVRLGPVLMTSLAALIGLLPMALALEEGS